MIIYESRWERFLTYFLVQAFSLLIAIAALNYIVNPLGIYAPGWFKPMVWNSRVEKLRLLKRAMPRPRVLIVGSSRSMKIAPSEVAERTGLPAFNASVESAMAEDYYVLIRYARERLGLDLKLIIVGLDLEALHNRRPMDERLLTSKLGSILHAGFTASWKQFTKLLSQEQLTLSLQSIAITFRRSPPVPASYFDNDGYLHYRAWEAERSTGRYDLDSKIQNSIVEYRQRFQGYTAVSAQRLGYLYDTFGYARAHGIRVIVFLTSLHPAVIRSLPGYEAQHRAVVGAVGHYCMQNNIPFFDMSSIQAYRGSLTGFYDGGHVNEQNASLITAALLKGNVNAIQ